MKIDTYKGSFGYPVLQEERYDYNVNTGFKVSFKRQDNTNTNIIYECNYTVDSQQLKKLIAEDTLEVILHIEQKTSRKIIKLTNSRTIVSLKKSDYAPDSKIEILPLIITKKDTTFSNKKETNSFYSIVGEWELKKASVVAVGELKQIAVNQQPSSYKSILKLWLVESLPTDFLIDFNDFEITVQVSRKFIDSFNTIKEKTALANYFILHNVVQMAIQNILLSEDFKIDEDHNIWEEFILEQIENHNLNIKDYLLGENVESKIKHSQFLTNKILSEKMYEAFSDQLDLVTRGGN